MYCKNNAIICDECGKFCQPFDEYTNFGCKYYDPPEPLDPCHICKKCWPKFKQQWINSFKGGSRYGTWMKSKAEIEAAKECGLIWKEDPLYCYIDDK